MRDSETEAHQEANDQPQSPVACDAEIQVTPDRKNARIQTSTRMKSIGRHNASLYIQVIVIFIRMDH